MYVTNIAAMTAIATPSTTDEVLVGGYYTEGDLGGGEFIWMTGTRPTEDGGFIIYHDSLTTGWFQRVVTEAAINVRWFGAKGDGTTDDLSVFTTIIGLIGTGGFETIFIPKGDYYLSDTLDIVNKTINIIGESGSDHTGEPTQLSFAAGKMGLQLRRTSGYGYQESLVENLRIIAKGKSGSSDNHGLHITQRSTIRYVIVGGFKDNGFHATGDLGPYGTDVSLSLFERCRSSQNDGHGFYIDGADANQCVFYLCDAVDNDGWGFFDSSFLGNHFYACHTNNNITGPYKSDNANTRSTFIACYSEEGSNPSDLGGKSMVFGGLHGSGIIGGTQFVDNQVISGTAIGSGLVYPSVNGEALTIGNAVINLKGRSPSGPIMYFRPVAEADDDVTWWETNYVNSDGPSIFSLAGDGALLGAVSGYSLKRYIDYSTVQMRQFFLQNLMIKSMPSRGWFVEEPGAYFAGDFILNRAYDGTNPQGWMCVEPGTKSYSFTETLTATRTASDQITLDTATTQLKQGYTIQFAGARAVIMNILSGGTVLHLDRLVPNASDQSVTLLDPVFRAWGTGYGPTSKRPTSELESTDAGWQYYDTDIDALIYWDGSSWVDTQEATGSSTQSGDGSTTSFTIAHSLSTTPSYFNAVANNEATANIQYVTADSTNITVHYSTAPASGTDNLVWAWIAKV